MICANKVMHEHSWRAQIVMCGEQAMDVFICEICGVIHTSDNPKVEFKPPFAYFYAIRLGAPLGRLFAISGG